MKINIKKITNIFMNQQVRILAIICCCLFIVCLFVFMYQLYMPLSKNVAEKEFVIREGEGLEKIAENLRMERIIGNKWVFVFHVWLEGKANNLQAGKYKLSSSMNVAEVAHKIISGDVFRDWVKITIPEGWTSKQIEEKLVELEIVNPKEYKLYTVSTESFPFLIDKPKDSSLQGYLFPDTYYFEKNTVIEDVVKKMLANFDQKLSQDLRDEIKKQDKTIHEILIMASILEKEIKSDEDRVIVAGIFWKRLENKYPLESCATIAYILGVDKWRYSYEDTRIKSPYNTYINIGLPPTPINNPGLSALRAAIYPQETDYNFFLTDPETGNTIFSKTFQEHNRNKAKYFK